VPREFGARSGIGSVALAASVLAVVTLMIVVFLPQVPAANPNAHSSSLGSSAVSISGSSAIQPAVQYPLVWAPNPLSACEAGAFCINATLGFSGQPGTTNNNTSSATTIIGSNATTIVISSTTTIIRSSETDWVFPSPATSYFVTLFAFVQDAVTGQNATIPRGYTVVGSGCYIQPTGLTHCLVSAPYLPVVPSGHPYKVTVFVTQADTPCSLQKANEPCSSQLLAPPSPTITVSEGE